MPPSQYVSPDEIRKRFNEGRYFERLQEGEFVADVTDVGPSRLVSGARSQTVRYRTQQGQTVAIVHQDGDPLGNPAPGRLPDPKYLFDKGVRLRPSAIAPHPPLPPRRSKRPS